MTLSWNAGARWPDAADLQGRRSLRHACAQSERDRYRPRLSRARARAPQPQVTKLPRSGFVQRILVASYLLDAARDLDPNTNSRPRAEHLGCARPTPRA